MRIGDAGWWLQAWPLRPARGSHSRCWDSLRPPRATALAVTLGVFAWTFPAQPSAAQTREGSFTVKFLHRSAEWALPETGVTLVFVLLAVLKGLALANGVIETLARWRAGRLGEAEALPWDGDAAFLIVMPFSYMPWEQYALLLFMLQGAALAMVMDSGMPQCPNPILNTQSPITQ